MKKRNSEKIIITMPVRNLYDTNIFYKTWSPLLNGVVAISSFPVRLMHSFASMLNGLNRTAKQGGNQLVTKANETWKWTHTFIVNQERTNLGLTGLGLYS